ncbi:MAG: cation:proton antiporter [Cyanobacteria bacterium P01_C01_bin.89]
MIELLPIGAIFWAAFPFFVGFSIYLLPQLSRALTLVVTFSSLIFAGLIFWLDSPQTFQLLDSFGVTLTVDTLGGFFILTNALVTLAVLLYCWRSDKVSFFYTQLILLHGSVNAAFLCADFISLYVALEVLSIASFLLVTYSRSPRSIWVGLRYLFISNTAMLFYLVGTALVFKATHSFQFQGLIESPPEATALIFLGLLAKGGIFVSGLWLPQTHSQAESPVSAMLSGVVVKTAVLAMVRCALLVPALDPVLRLAGVATALLGVAAGMVERDTKRMLALSTVSQLGFVLAVPATAGAYALTHGLAKGALFLVAGALPSRDFKVLQEKPIARSLWAFGAIAALSVSGMPLIGGFVTKALVSKSLPLWQGVALNVAAVGTAALCAKLIFLPHSAAVTAPGKVKNLLPSMVVLLGGLMVANGVNPSAYSSLDTLVKAVGIVGGGWLLYWIIIRRVTLKLPWGVERLEHLTGTMSLSAIAIFLLVLYLMPLGGVTP